MGKEGSIFIHNNNASYCSPFKVKVEDTSGAGDAFMAGLIFATLSEYSPVSYTHLTLPTKA